MFTRLLNPFSLLSVLLCPASFGEVLISQYYEGSSGFNKWIELSNTSDTAVSLDGYALALGANSNTDAWKIGNIVRQSVQPVRVDNLDGLTIPASGFLLLGNRLAGQPSYATSDLAAPNITSFNGNDSVVLYFNPLGKFEVGDLDHEAVIDAISFTYDGNEGKDLSFYRISNARGFDHFFNTSILNYPNVWASATEAEVETAVPSDPFYLHSFNSSATEFLAVSLSVSTIAEDRGVGQVGVTVTRTGSLINDLAVTLATDDESEASIGTLTGVIPAGEESIFLPAAIDIVDDLIADGSQEVVITASASGWLSGTAILIVTDDTDATSISITEILAYIPFGREGDANRDGDTNWFDDEFVEIVNNSGASTDLTGWTLHNSSEERHRFAPGTVLPIDCAMVVFGGGNLSNMGGSAIFQTASSGSLGLNNWGDTVTLYNADGDLMASVTYGSEAREDQSIVRDPEITGPFSLHGSVADGRLFSPGTRSNGDEYCTPLAELSFSLNAARMSERGGTITAILTRTGDLSESLDVVITVTDESEALMEEGVRTKFFEGENTLTIELVGQDDIAEDGTQLVQIRAAAPGYATATASFEVEDDGDGAFDAIVLNEFLSSPSANLGPGDTNRDGTRDFSQDEFVEFLNVSEEDIDLSNYEIHDAVGARHVFPIDTVLAAGQAIVVFGGGTPWGAFGRSVVQVASSGSLGLNDGGDSIYLKTFGGDTILIEHRYDGTTLNQSMSRSPEGTGGFINHTLIEGAEKILTSPGTKADGERFSGAAPHEPIEIVAFEVDLKAKRVMMEVSGLQRGENYYAGASADLGPEAEWVSFGPFPMFPEREIAPGTFLVTFTDLSILQNSPRFYKIAGP